MATSTQWYRWRREKNVVNNKSGTRKDSRVRRIRALATSNPPSKK